MPNRKGLRPTVNFFPMIADVFRRMRQREHVATGSLPSYLCIPSRGAFKDPGRHPRVRMNQVPDQWSHEIRLHGLYDIGSHHCCSQTGSRTRSQSVDGDIANGREA